MYNIKTGPQTDDIWCILWRQREREAVATGFPHRPYATPEWQWIWHARIYVITDFMLNGLYRIYACIFRGQLSDSGTQSKFWLRPVYIKGTNLQKSFTGKPAFNTLWLPCQWSVTQQRDSPPGTVTSTAGFPVMLPFWVFLRPHST